MNSEVNNNGIVAEVTGTVPRKSVAKKPFPKKPFGDKKPQSKPTQANRTEAHPVTPGLSEEIINQRRLVLVDSVATVHRELTNLYYVPAITLIKEDGGRGFINCINRNIDWIWRSYRLAIQTDVSWFRLVVEETIRYDKDYFSLLFFNRFVTMMLRKLKETSGLNEDLSDMKPLRIDLFGSDSDKVLGFMLATLEHSRTLFTRGPLYDTEESARSHAINRKQEANRLIEQLGLGEDYFGNKKIYSTLRRDIRPADYDILGEDYQLFIRATQGQVERIRAEFANIINPPVKPIRNTPVRKPTVDEGVVVLSSEDKVVVQAPEPKHLQKLEENIGFKGGLSDLRNLMTQKAPETEIPESEHIATEEEKVPEIVAVVTSLSIETDVDMAAIDDADPVAAPIEGEESKVEQPAPEVTQVADSEAVTQ